ncbi:SDR family NAD(P)-dependent oxidoreductase, partial [Acinetobacter baumannii]
QEKLDRVVAYARGRGVEIIGVAGNVREHEQVLNIYAQAEAAFGAPDLVVNSAGGQFPQAAIDYAPKGWSAVVNNNLNGTWFMMQRAAQRWRDL